MTIDKRMPELARRTAAWARTRAAVAGGDAVRDAGETFLPRLSGQTAKEYRGYQMRPVFFEATGRTRSAMTGLAFAKPAEVALPSNIADFEADADAGGLSLQEFVANILSDLQETDFGVVCVMHNGDPANPGTAANPSGRPYLKFYEAESVLGYKFQVVAGKRQLSQLRVKEFINVPSEDEFDEVEVAQIRVMDIGPLDTGRNAVSGFRERLYQEEERKDKAGKTVKTWVLKETRIPLNAGKPLQYVPARLVSSNGNAAPGAAPLAPLAEVNLSHWRTSADYEHALHFCGLPTPYVTGVSSPQVRAGDVRAALDDVTGYENITQARIAAPQPSIKLGSSTVITFENPQAKMAFLQLDPSGIGALSEALDRKAAYMAVLGARMLAQEKSGVESGHALAIKRAGETSALARLCRALSDAVTDVLEMASEWAGGARGGVTYRINTEFGDIPLAAQEMTALLAMFNSGAISLETLIYNMRKAGRIEESVSDDDEKERIANGVPARTPANDDDVLPIEDAA